MFAFCSLQSPTWPRYPAVPIWWFTPPPLPLPAVHPTSMITSTRRYRASSQSLCHVQSHWAINLCLSSPVQDLINFHPFHGRFRVSRVVRASRIGTLGLLAMNRHFQLATAHAIQYNRQRHEMTHGCTGCGLHNSHAKGHIERERKRVQHAAFGLAARVC